MSRSFSVALILPALALARGDESGFGRDNAVETVLLTTDKGEELRLFTYNAINGEVLETHGDLELDVPDSTASPVYLQQQYREFGFCIEMDNGSWDCMKVQTDLLQTQEVSTSWSILDANGPLDNGVIQDANDVDFNAEDASLGWVSIASKSEITGCSLFFGNAVIDCEKVNAHWFRNMETSQTETDNQLSVEDVEKRFNVVGFSFNGAESNYAFENTDIVVNDDNTKQVQFVFQATADAVAPAEEEVDEEEGEEKVDEEVVDEEDDDEEVVDEEDDEEEEEEEEEEVEPEGWSAEVGDDCAVQDDFSVKCPRTVNVCVEGEEGEAEVCTDVAMDSLLPEGCSLNDDDLMVCVAVCPHDDHEDHDHEGHDHDDMDAADEEDAAAEEDVPAEEEAPVEGDEVRRLQGDEEEEVPVVTTEGDEEVTTEGDEEVVDEEVVDEEDGEEEVVEEEEECAEEDKVINMPEGCTVDEDGLVDCDPANAPAGTGLPEMCALNDDGLVLCEEGVDLTDTDCTLDDDLLLTCEEGTDVSVASKCSLNDDLQVVCAEPVDEEEGQVDETEEDEENGDDGATNVTTYAAALVAAVYALVF